ncbi:Exocyst complex component 6B [Halotydeus destructor]|nr:Exocyst complex component 6B [Halotydeus destructor]
MAKNGDVSIDKLNLAPSNGLDNLIYETESTDTSSVGLVLRAIYERDEYEDFMSRLDGRIKAHDKNIERMCNAHYQGFVDCIHELLQVRPQAQRLKKEITSINQETLKSAENVQRKAEELIRCRRIQCNAENAIEHLTVCLSVLEIYEKLVSQMNENKYYPALKTLEQLEHTYLPRVSKYRFAQAMCVKIPLIREQIKDASMKGLKDFLENVRKLSERLGEIALKNASRQQNVDADSIFPSNNGVLNNGNSPQHKLSQHNGDVSSGSTSRKSSVKKRKAPAPPNPFTGDVDSEPSSSVSPVDDQMGATDLVDFSPVYRCLHIFTCLGAREQFEEYYRQQRQEQAKLVLQTPANMHESMDGYKSYFCGIIGFFVIEDHVLNTANGLVTKSYLDEIWHRSQQSLISSLRSQMFRCVDENFMLNLKKLILLFSYTLKSYGFDIVPLFDLLLEIRDQYNELLMKRWKILFKKIFDADNYHPMAVNNLNEYNDVINEFPFYEADFLTPSKEDFPKKFPFSSFVPKVYSEVKKFIVCCHQFSQDLNSSQTEIENMVRRSTNLLLTRTLSECLSELIKNPNLGLLQLIQITINTNYLEDACVHLEEFISRTINSPTAVSIRTPATPVNGTDMSRLSRFQGTSMFKDTRADAESQIYLQLNQKINEFLELATYDWLLVESRGMASSYISDLIAFLKSTFEAFTNLPLNVAQTACHSACKHIASSLMNFLMDEEEKCVSSGALEQFNLDLIQCELFAAGDPVKGFEDGALHACFAELRQLMDLFTSWDWSTYFADYGKQDSKYLRVNPQTALNLLEKQKEADKKKNLFTSLKKNERDKKKLIDTVAKQLRQLVVSNNAL